MYLLEWSSKNTRQLVGIFESIEHGRFFMKKVPGYNYTCVDIDGVPFEEETIEYAKLPDIELISHNGYQIPISRFSFEEDIIVLWIPLDYLDSATTDNRVSIGSIKVDAYSINNENAKNYIEERELRFKQCRELFTEHDFEVSRECFGSEDGEVIFVRKKGQEDRWYFFTHMDPLFLEMNIEQEIEKYIQSIS